MISKILESLIGKRILILGFGIEGRASLRFIQNYLPETEIGIADKNGIDISSFKESHKLILHSGTNYLSAISDYDVIIKSPGIPDKSIRNFISDQILTSQTDLFLSAFSKQIIGITGTKGKSTTASLIYSILSEMNENVLLVGNIGMPPFDELEKIDKNTKIVFELSSHQLENVCHSPHISILLNLFEEHLDHYTSYEDYQLAKFNITSFQSTSDYFICNYDNKIIRNLNSGNPVQSNVIYYSLRDRTICSSYKKGSDEIFLKTNNLDLDFGNRQGLPGDHNLSNIMAATLVCEILKVPFDIIQEVVNGFKSLPHRLEYLGEFKGVKYYNDSISTIPEATIAAINTIKNVDVLIIGGFDRGIDYNILSDFLSNTRIQTIIFTGNAGHRIYNLLNEKSDSIDQLRVLVCSFFEIENVIRQHVKKGSICLLSPAASSYDEFNSFKERGDAFKKIAENI